MKYFRNGISVFHLILKLGTHKTQITTMYNYTHTKKSYRGDGKPISGYLRRGLWLLALMMCNFLLPDYAIGQMVIRNQGSAASTFLFNSTVARRNQILYPPASLTGPVSGNINKIYFERGNTTTAATTASRVIIKLGQTTTTAYGGSTTFLTGLTTVFDGAINIPAGATGAWFSIDLTSNFPYLATQTLIVETEFCGTINNGISASGSSPSGNTRIYHAGSTSNTCASYTPAATGTTTTTLPDFGFDVVSGANNDASLASIAFQNTCSTSQNLQANVINLGGNAINSLSFEYSINGGATQTSTVTGLNIPSSGGSATVNIASAVSLAINTDYNVTATITGVNSTTDPDLTNNTSSLANFRLGLSGTYTINPSGSGAANFTTISAAVNRLTSSGVCGPVTFNIANGTYGSGADSSYIISAITGSSATNTVTFQSQSGNAADVIIQKPVITATTFNYIFQLNDADYVTFKNLTIRRTSNPNVATITNTRVIDVNSGSDFTTIEGCSLSAPTPGTASTSNAIVFSLTTAPINISTTVKNCVITGGQGINLGGTAINNMELNHVIEGNNITSLGSAILVTNSRNLIIRNNNSFRLNGGGVSAGSACTLTGIRGGEVSGNDFEADLTTQCLFLSRVFGPAGSPFRVFNNNLRGNNAGTTANYGIQTTVGCRNLEIKHNNIYNTGTSNATYGVYFNDIATAPDSSQIVFQGNNVVLESANGGNSAVIWVEPNLATGTNISFNSNNYFRAPTATAAIFRWNTTFESNEANIPTLTSGDANSVFVDPAFNNLTAMQPQSPFLDGLIARDAAILVDKAGANRNNPTDVGPYEFTPASADAGVDAIVVTNTNGAVFGSQQVSVVVKNYAALPLTSVKINWSFNGVAQTQVNVTGLNVASGGSTTVVLGTRTFAASAPFTIVASTTLPNNVADGNSANDAFTLNGRGAFAGIITMNPANAVSNTNFQTLTSLFDALELAGVSGDLTVQIASGTYPDFQHNLGTIPNASVSSRVTITSATGNAADVTISLPSSTSTTTPPNYIIRLTGTDFITFDKLTFVRGGTATNARHIELFNGADNVEITNCTFVGPTQTAASTTANAAIYSTTNAVNDNNTLISGNTFNSGTAMYIQGISRNNLESGLRVLNNTVNCFGYGIYVLNQADVEIVGNVVTRYDLSATTTFIGIGLFTSHTGKINRNRVTCYNGPQGIQLSSVIGMSPSTPFEVINNAVSTGHSATTLSAPLRMLSGCRNIRIWHNSLLHYGSPTNTTGRGAMVITQLTTDTTTDINMQNNLFSATGTTYAVDIDANVTNAVTSNNNNLQGNATAFSRWGGVIQTTFTGYKTASSQDAASTDLNPGFISDQNLYPSNLLMDNTGAALGVTVDVLNVSRSLTTPDKGAYEYSPPANDGAIGGVTVGNQCPGSLTPIVEITNLGINAITTATFSWTVNGIAQSNFTASGLNIANSASFNINFPAITVVTGSVTVAVTLESVNGITETLLTGNSGSGTGTISNSFSVPFLQDWTSGTILITQPSGWIGTPTPSTSAFSWNVEDGPSSSTGTSPSTDRSGIAGGKYTFTESSSGALGAIADLVSPCFNITGMTDPYVTFWYHMFGETMGSLEIAVRPAGGNWTTLWTISGQQQTLATDPWRQGRASLIPYIGQVVQFRIRGIRGSSFTSDMAVDDFGVENLPGIDAEAVSVNMPTGGCNTTAPLTVTIKNNSGATLNTITINYTINGQAQTAVTPTGLNLGLNQSATITLAASRVYSGNTTVVVTLSNPNGVADLFTSNNSATNSINYLPILTGGFSQNFESGGADASLNFPTGWTTSGTATTQYTWLMGLGTTPTTTTTGPRVDKTLGTALGRYAYIEATNTSPTSATLTSPCFTTVGLVSPTLKFGYHMFGNQINTLSVDVYNGSAWVNDVFILTGQQQAAGTSPWLEGTVSLSAFANTSGLRLRFRAERGAGANGDIAIDDIAVYDANSADIAAVGFVGLDGCLNATSPLVVTIKNEGNTALNMATNPVLVNCLVQRGTSTVTNLNTTVNTGTLAPGATTNVTFNSIITSVAGDITFTATASFVGDFNSSNAIYSITRNRAIDVATPLVNNFTGATATVPGTGWTEGTGVGAPTGTTSTWTIGAAAQNTWFGGGTVAKILLSATTDREWIISPTVTVPSNAALSFDLAFTGSSVGTITTNAMGADDTLAVFISTDCGVSWQRLWNFTNADRVSQNIVNSFKVQSIDLSAYAGQRARFGFFATEGNASNTGYDLILDNINIGVRGTFTGIANTNLADSSNYIGGMPSGSNPVIAPAGNITITGTATFPSVQVNAGSTITVNGTLNVTGNLTINGNLTGTGTIILNGTTLQNITGSGSLDFFNLTLNNSAGAEFLANSGRIRNTLTITNGVFDLNGRPFTFVSTQALTARLAEVNPANLTGATNVTMQRWLENRGGTTVTGTYYLFGTPITGRTFADFASAGNTVTFGSGIGASVWTYNPTDNLFGGWVPVSSGTTALNPGVGSRVFMRKAFFNAGGVMPMTGALTTGNVLMPLTYCSGGSCGGGSNNGYNLIANPYPSQIDWMSVNRPAGVNGTIWVWSHSKAGYVSVVGGVGDTPPAQGGITNVLASGQGFFVEATGAGETITFEEADKVSGTASFGRMAAPIFFRASITNAQGISDYTAIQFKAGASASFNKMEDATKFEGGILNLYSAFGANKAAVNILPELNNATIVPLGVNAAAAGRYVFKISDLENLPSGTTVYLRDHFTGTVTLLDETSEYEVNITSSPASFGNNRLELVVVPQATTGSIDDILTKTGVSVAVYPNPAKSSGDVVLAVNGFDAKGIQVTISNMVGQVVMSESLAYQGGASQYRLANKLPSGVYMVNVVQGKTEKKLKLVVE